MLTKNEIKYIQSLRHKKQRDQDGLFIAEGPRLAEELINSQFTIKHIYATAAWLTNRSLPQNAVTEISEVELSRISNLQTPNEVLAIAMQHFPQSEPMLKGTLTLVLDAIQDPGNMGTIIRIADWFGVKQIVAGYDSVEMYNPKVVQATMGSITRVHCFSKDLHQWKLPPDLPVFGALLKGENIYAAGKVSEGLLVIGNESKGIGKSFLSKITHPVTIPKIGDAESLNAAVATGIILGCLLNNQ